MAFSTLGGHLRATELLSLLADTIEAGENSASEHRSFLFAKYRRHLDHGAAHRRRGVDALLVAIQADAGSIEFGQGIRHVEDAASQPIDRPAPSERHSDAARHPSALRRRRDADPDPLRR